MNNNIDIYSTVAEEYLNAFKNAFPEYNIVLTRLIPHGRKPTISISFKHPLTLYYDLLFAEDLVLYDFIKYKIYRLSYYTNINDLIKMIKEL